MQKKSLISSVISVLLLSILFGYSLVFGAVGDYSGPVRLEYNEGMTIYSSNITLNKTKLLFRSGVDLTDIKITSTCDTFTRFISKKSDLYLLELKYFPNCTDGNISILNNEGKEIYSTEMKILSESDLWGKFIDFSPEDIHKTQSFISKKLLLLSKRENNSNNLEQYKYDRQLKELQYLQNFLQNIQKKREEKYMLPVAGYKIGTNSSRVPNTARPYRETYTDGIHHGWDIGGKLGEPVRALDNAIVVRIVSGFEYSDISKIDKTGEMTNYKEAKNLDILRGNQVWLKTAKGDVVFYSHLTDIYSQIKEGVMVRKGELLGTIGKTGVPGLDYNDYHLHFAIQKNPYTKEKYGTYTNEDYMLWDWYFKGQPVSDVLKYEDEIFE